MRAPDGQPLRWRVRADVEALAWSPHAPTTFLVSGEDGLVSSYDARAGAGSGPLFRLSAHDAATCALSFNPAAPGLLATASTDAQVCCTPLACPEGGSLTPPCRMPDAPLPRACCCRASNSLHRRREPCGGRGRVGVATSTCVTGWLGCQNIATPVRELGQLRRFRL